MMVGRSAVAPGPSECDLGFLTLQTVQERLSPGPTFQARRPVSVADHRHGSSFGSSRAPRQGGISSHRSGPRVIVSLWLRISSTA